MTLPKLLWEWGTAYDLFMSLAVLHNPAEFGVRGAWAAGVRARLPAAEREILEQSNHLIYVPLRWLHTLPEPRDAMTVLWTLGQVPPAERLPLLSLDPTKPCDTAEILKMVAERKAWDDKDLQALRALHGAQGEKAPLTEKLTLTLDWWARAEEFGERYLAALQAYQDAFFSEEERRIATALQDALAHSRDMAGRLALPDLLEELSQGLRFAELPTIGELVLVPSYWITPLVLFSKMSAERILLLFGARPQDASLVPGEAVPDALLRALKALSDPTRLRILHYLTQEPLTPAELSRRLRLRVPTVMHHLKTLRLASLVQFTINTDKEAKLYATRPGAVSAICVSLKAFLGVRESGDVQADTNRIQ
jgi:hypothetical protein